MSFLFGNKGHHDFPGHPEAEPALGLGEIGSACPLVELNARLVPVEALGGWVGDLVSTCQLQRAHSSSRPAEMTAFHSCREGRVGELEGKATLVPIPFPLWSGWTYKSSMKTHLPSQVE